MIKKFIFSQILKRVKKEDLFKWFVEANVLPSIEPSLQKADSPEAMAKIKTVQVKIDAPEEGGVLAYFPGKKYPFPGFPNRKIVWQTARAKRLIPIAVDWMYDFIKLSLPENPQLYCKFVREIYRLFNIAIERNTSPGQKKKWVKIRDIVCMFAEYDNAYRFMFQDIAEEANLEEMKMTNGDKWWFTVMDFYSFKNKEEFIKKHGKRKAEW